VTIRYVGPGGADSDTGLSWGVRKLTLNGVEDTPVVAGDTIYVGPGVYREELAVDVSGAGGSIITYIGDVTGEHTDGVGGIVRITGSDNDQATARDRAIKTGWQDYRTFRGFRIDMCAITGIYITNSENVVVEDCVFADNTQYHIEVDEADQSSHVIRRCAFFVAGQAGIYFSHSSEVDDTGHLVENCLFMIPGTASYRGGIKISRIGGITMRNCILYGGYRGIYVDVALTEGQANTVENSILTGHNEAVRAINAGELVEDYNTFYLNGTDRTNVNVGGNSVAYPALVSLPILHSGASQVSGFKFPWWFGELSEWSQVRAITGSNEPTEDLRGIARPATASKNSWGAVQFADAERDTGTTYNSSAASLELSDAARVQLGPFEVPNASIDIHVKVYREADYAGTNPQLVIKQPGASDDTTVDTASDGQWNELTTTLTPNADPSYVFVELVSNNTAAAGSYATYFDQLVVNGKVVDFNEWVTDRIILKDHEAYVRWPRARGM